MVIGVSGVAGAGKDLFSETLKQELESKGQRVHQISLAEALKQETKEWCLEQYGIDPTNCSREDKEKVRAFLVFHGTFKRRLTQGRHWVDIANSIIKELENQFDYFIISDIRYADFDCDEVSWVKKELGGILVHVSQYTKEPELKHEPRPARHFLPPANSEEARNDPKLLEACDYSVKWELIFINKDKYIKNHVVKFSEWLYAR